MRTREILMMMLASAFGFVGGAVYSRVHTLHVDDAQVLRGHRFELLDDSGRVIAFGRNDNLKNVVLGFRDKDDHSVATFGLGSDRTPFFDMAGKDGKSRVRLELDWMQQMQQKPTLVMSDEKWEGRVMFGFLPSDYPDREWDDWGLAFRAPNVGDLANIGLIKRDGKLSGVANVRAAGKVWSVP